MGLVILADSDAGFISTLSEALLAQPMIDVVAVDCASDVLGLARSRVIDAVVFGPTVPAEDTFSVVSSLAADPAPSCVIVARELSTDLMRRALRLGVSDVLSVADPPADLVAAVASAAEAARARRVDEPTEVQAATPPRQGKVVTVFGTKGGVGKSVLATNIAVALAEGSNSTILVDLDLQFGDTAIMLQLVPERTIYDVVQAYDRLDTDMLSAFLSAHDSGLRALLAPVQPEQAEAVTGVRLGHIIELLSQMADYVVIDTSATLNDAVLTAVQSSDEVYAVATMDVPSLKNAKVSLEKLAQVGVSRDRVRLVLNRADSKVGLSASDVENVTGCSIVAKVPSDRLVPRSVNKGVPVVRDAPRSPVARSIVDLARSITVPEVRSDVA